MKGSQFSGVEMLWEGTVSAYSFGWIAQNYRKSVPFHKMPTPGNSVKLRNFTQLLHCANIYSLKGCSVWAEPLDSKSVTNNQY